MDCNNIDEFRSCLLRIKLSKILLARMTPYVIEIIGEYQCGFRSNRSNVDHIFSIRQILEKKWKYDKNECQLFIDFKRPMTL